MNAIIDFIDKYLSRYPMSEIRDLYKVLYQAFHGPEHAIHDAGTASMWLRGEWDGLSTASVDDNPPLIESAFIGNVTPLLYRVNLKPAKLAGIEPEVVFAEFIRASEEFPEYYPDETSNLHDIFISTWKNLGGIITEGALDLDYDAYVETSRLASENEWGAMHHSELFRETYDPHYRLVMKAEFYK